MYNPSRPGNEAGCNASQRIQVEKKCDKQLEVYEMKENENKFGANLPEKKFRAGAISATVWRNVVKTKDGQDAEVRTVSFDKRYKDKDTNEWKSSSSLRAMDLPKAVVVLNKAYEYIVLNGDSNITPELYI
jgi:hypothetical protein